MNAAHFVFGVDLDGVVADFIAGMRPVAAEWLGVEESELARDVGYGFAEWHLESMGKDATDGYERLHRFAVTQRNLFRDLPPIEGAPAALRRISALGVRIRIITHRLYLKHFHRAALAQTIDWLDHHGVPYWDLCFMAEKAAVGADLYIEDSPANIASLRDSGCEVICFGNSTNRGVAEPRVTTWQEVEALLQQRVARWRKGRVPRLARTAGISEGRKGKRQAS
jgi:beta-phosphoglucomutase-like phosphatase (HAD superfamily)